MFWLTTMSVLAVGLAAITWMERESRVRLVRTLEQALVQQQQLGQALGLERRRTAQAQLAVETKNREVDALVARLTGEQATSTQLRQALAEHQRQLSALQTDLVLAQQRATATGAVEIARITVPIHTRAARSLAKVVAVNPEWSFVVFDAGWDQVNIGDVLSVYRQEALIARVQVERVQQRLAAARVLPAYPVDAIAIDDQVQAP
jgi:hypothetical protein